MVEQENLSHKEYLELIGFYKNTHQSSNSRLQGGGELH